jgi:hypothetical protein
MIENNAVTTGKIDNGTITDDDLNIPMSITNSGNVFELTSTGSGEDDRPLKLKGSSIPASTLWSQHSGSAYCYYARTTGSNADFFLAFDLASSQIRITMARNGDIDTDGAVTARGEVSTTQRATADNGFLTEDSYYDALHGDFVAWDGHVSTYDQDRYYPIPEDGDDGDGDVTIEDDARVGHEVIASAGYLMPRTGSKGNYYTYAVMSRDFFLVERGTGKLTDGVTTITLDPSFSEQVAVDEEHPILVQITLADECNGVYVSDRNERGFTVRELGRGTSNASFFWEVTCTPADHLGARSRTWLESDFSEDREKPEIIPFEQRRNPAFFKMTDSDGIGIRQPILQSQDVSSSRNSLETSILNRKPSARGAEVQ